MEINASVDEQERMVLAIASGKLGRHIAPANPSKNLIELKLASGLAAPARLKNLADVPELIRVLHLPNTYAEQLDDSVRSESLKLWTGVAQAQDLTMTESKGEYE